MWTLDSFKVIGDSLVDNYSFLDEIIINRVDAQKINLDYDNFKKRVLGLREVNSSLDIQISDASENNFYKLFAFQELIDTAYSSIDIFTSEIDEDMFDNIYVIFSIKEWLAADENRQVRILLKKDIDIKSKKIKLLLGVFGSRLSIKLSKMRDIEDCYRDCVIFDDTAFMASEKSDQDDVALFNFNAIEASSNLKSLFEIAYSDRIADKFPSDEKLVGAIADIKNEISKVIHSTNLRTVSPYFKPIVSHG